MNIFRRTLAISIKSFRKPSMVYFANSKVEVQTQPKQALALIPKLVRKPDQLLLQNWWSESRNFQKKLRFLLFFWGDSSF